MNSCNFRFHFSHLKAWWFFASFSLLVLPAHSPATLWGFYGHKRINELAVYTLPPGMFGFYKHHLDYLIEHSVDPDKRRYSVKGEAERHYIDMDHYCFDSTGCNPFINVPRRWTEAVERFTEDTLRAHGIVPWHIYLMLQKLTDAFKNEDTGNILRLSAELGHYVGDAHVPLHTTSNYNGQKTGQRGIHGFWESRLPELYDGNYDFYTGKATFIQSPLNYIWQRVEESYAAVDTVLGFEAQLNNDFNPDRKFSYEVRGQVNMKVYSEPYSRAYHTRLDGQVERRMRTAVISLGSLWYTCWVNAGQPDLNKLPDLPVQPADSESQEELPTDAVQKIREHDN